MAAFNPKEAVKILKKLGFLEKRQTGSHLILYHPLRKITIPVPIHNKDIGKGLLRAIIKKAKSSDEEFQKLR